jgi:hypothetical protein
MKVLKTIIGFLSMSMVNFDHHCHEKKIVEKPVKGFIVWGETYSKKTTNYGFFGKKTQEACILLWGINGEKDWFWSQPWDMKSNTVGQPSPYFFYINYRSKNNNIQKKLKVFIPQNNSVKNGAINNFKIHTIEKARWDPFKNQGYIQYNVAINKKVVKNEVKIIDPQDHDGDNMVENEVIFPFEQGLFSQTHPLQGFFTVDATDNGKAQDNEPMTLQYKFKNNHTMKVLWDKEKRSILSCEIFKKNQLVYKNNCDNYKFFHLNKYPTEFSLEPHRRFLKILNGLANTITDKMEVVITKTFFIKNDYSLPSLEKYLKTLKLDKKYVLIIVPIRLITFQDGVSENRFHLFPVAILLEKFHDIWVLKKIVSTNTCLNQFTFLNYQLHNIVVRFLNHGPNKIIQKLKVHKDIAHSIVDNVAYNTDGNHILRLTDFLQLRQSGANSCYTSWAKDALIIVDYLKDFIETEENNNPGLHKKSALPSSKAIKIPNKLVYNTLSCKDFFTCSQFSLIYDQWNPQQFNILVENFFLTHKTNVNLLHIHDKFLAIMEVVGSQDNGPLKGEDNLVYFKERLMNLRKKHYIFFITIGNKVVSYCIYRSKENTLNNQRYWDEFKKVSNKYYPHLTVEPLRYIPVDNFQGKSHDENLNILYQLLQLSVQLPSIYNELKDFSLAFEGSPSTDEYVYNSFILYNMEKSITADYAGDIYMAILFTISKNFLNKKEAKIQETIKENFKKEYQTHEQNLPLINGPVNPNEESNLTDKVITPVDTDLPAVKKNLVDYDLEEALKILTNNG